MDKEAGIKIVRGLISRLSKEDRLVALEAVRKNRFGLDPESFLNVLQGYYHAVQKEGWTEPFAEYLELGGYISQNTIQQSRDKVPRPPNAVDLSAVDKKSLETILITFTQPQKQATKPEQIEEVQPITDAAPLEEKMPSIHINPDDIVMEEDMALPPKTIVNITPLPPTSAGPKDKTIPMAGPATYTPKARDSKLTIHGTVTKHLYDERRYTAKKDLGGGGMGSIVLMSDKAFDREVIRKKPQRDDPESLKEFEREMRLSGKLVHANIPPVYEAGVDPTDNKPYFDMLKIDGKDVSNYIFNARQAKGKGEDYSLEKRIKIFADITKAMAYSHSEGIIHRDLKPQNVMLGKNGVVYVIDWGLAKIVDEKEDARVAGGAVEQKQLTNEALDEDAGLYKTLETGMIKGTLHYLAPEQASGGMPLDDKNYSEKEIKQRFAVDEKSDQYTLGAILYELATLQDFRLFSRQPHGRTDQMIIVSKIAQGKFGHPDRDQKGLRTRKGGDNALYVLDIIPAAQANKEVPAELESIINKATQHDKRNRYPSVAYMLRDVEAYLSGGYVAAHNYSFKEKVAKKIRNNPIKAAVGAVASTVGALAIAGIIGVYGHMSGQVTEKELEKSRAETIAKEESVKKATAEAKAAREEQAREKAEKDKLAYELSVAKGKSVRQQALEQLSQGEDILYRRKGNLEDAIKFFDKAISIDPDWNDAYFKRGLAYYDSINGEKALADFINANQKSLKENKKIDARALFYAGMNSIDYYDDPEKATPYLAELIEKSENKNEQYFILGQSIVEFNKGNYKESIALLDGLIKEKPLWEAHYLRSLMHSQGLRQSFNRKELAPFCDYKLAITDAANALSLDSTKFRPLFHRCQLYIMTGQNDLALVDANKLLEMNLPAQFIHNAKARVLLNTEKYSESLEVLVNAERIFGSLDEESLRTRGLIYFNTGKYDGAEADLTKVIAKFNEASDYSYRGLARMELGKLDDALRDFNETINRAPSGEAYLYRGQCEVRLKNYDNALTDYGEAVDRGTVLGYYFRGRLYAALNKIPEAIVDIEKYLKTSDETKRDQAQQLLDKLKGN